MTFAVGFSMLACAPRKLERLHALPENPCDILSAVEVSKAARVEVVRVERVPSIQKIVNAQRANAEPGPGTICVYETRSALGGITIWVPPDSERTRARYLEQRDAYRRSYRGSGRAVSGLGEDAWMAGGASLTILVRDDTYFGIGIQYGGGPQIPDILGRLGRAAVHRF